MTAMIRLFDKMAAFERLSQADFAELFAEARPAPAEIAALLGYLLGRQDGDEAAAFIQALRDRFPQRTVRVDGRPTVNLVGTGGGRSTFNITTTTAFVVSAAGAVVVKTGSGAWRSRTGFAEVAGALGAMKAVPWEQLEAIAREVGIVFIPPLYTAPILARWAHALGAATFRNVAGYVNKLGPLLSPVRVDHRFIGVTPPAALEMLARASAVLGDVPATLVASDDGLDEVSTAAGTSIVRLAADGTRRDTRIDPGELSIKAPQPDELQGSDPAESADICAAILAGRGSPAQTDIVAVNAAVVLAEIGAAASVRSGLDEARRLLREGAALRKLEQLRERMQHV
jgi:anthranilate phosphoribosyltransferase